MERNELNDIDIYKSLTDSLMRERNKKNMNVWASEQTERGSKCETY